MMFHVKTVGTAALALIRCLSFPAYADGQPGKFDYYLLTLSWLPEHCAEVKNDKTQCNGTKPYGFVVHGLWPQYDRGYPASAVIMRPVQ